MRKSNYDKMPATVVDGTLWKGWESIRMDHKFGWWNATKGFITRS